VVLHKSAIEGEFIKAGSSAYRIADLSSIWVMASVYDYELPWIKLGQTADMELSYQPGKKYTGKITYIYPDVDEKTRTVKIRLEFPNPQYTLKPGMFANIRIQTQPRMDVVTVPNEAIIRTGERNIVFIANGNGSFEPRDVTLGIEGGPNNNDIEILAGLEPGVTVVTSAQFLLDSESRLQEAIQKMLNQGKNQEPADMENMDHSEPMEADQTMNDTDAMSSDHEMSADTTDHSNMDM
jgi:Cu(I)/Ag(I) efflux system membrane fusion protein/cobalt-zinc-cadmium efflux system membrane fusion protein